jgi:hypothetical protein
MPAIHTRRRPRPNRPSRPAWGLCAVGHRATRWCVWPGGPVWTGDLRDTAVHLRAPDRSRFVWVGPEPINLDQERPGIQEGQTECTDRTQRNPVDPGGIPQQQHSPRNRERPARNSASSAIGASASGAERRARRVRAQGSPRHPRTRAPRRAADAPTWAMAKPSQPFICPPVRSAVCVSWSHCRDVPSAPTLPSRGSPARGPRHRPLAPSTPHLRASKGR